MPSLPRAEDFTAAYLRLGDEELGRRAAEAWRHLGDCDLCSRYCFVDRRATTDGAACRTGERAFVASYGPHHGEEDPLRGTRGSGTIFFSGCSLRCRYCQNSDISQKRIGREVEPAQIADMMLELQAQGCHNINLVTPSHVVAQIIAAVREAARRGLRLPIVYNSGGYDSPQALALLDGIVDIYMPDMKYGDSGLARRYSRVRNYVEANQYAVREMHRQVGDLVLGADGVALRGLLVRHLVLPQDIARTRRVLEFLAREISPETYVNLMDQYRPSYRAGEYPELARALSGAEYADALAAARGAGLHRLDRA